MSAIVAEIYQVARGLPVELSLENAIEQRTAIEKQIFEKVNELAGLGLTDMIAMMIPITTAPLSRPNYFGNLFGGPAALNHAEAFVRKGCHAISDVQRVMHGIFGVNPKQKFLFSLKEDKNSPAGMSVNKVLLLIDSENLTSKSGVELNRLKETMGVPDGYSVSELFTDTLAYTPESLDYEELLTSNLLLTYLMTTLGAIEPKIFTGEFNYKLSRSTGRSTYFPEEGEVLFEVSQPSEAPQSWFEIFDKADDETFDLNAELAFHINGNLFQLANAAG